MAVVKHNGKRSLEPVRELLEVWKDRGRQWDSKPFYPIYCDLVGRRCLVVGAGKIGEGKIRGLLDAGARVHVVSLAATDAVKQWADEGKIELGLRAFEPNDLDGCFLVIAATEDSETNIAVHSGAAARDMLCNVVDVPPLCNFIVPSVHRQGDLAVAISTAGASPALARRIRLKIAACYGEEYGVVMELLGSLREELKERYPDADDRKVIFERMVYSDLMEWVRGGETERVEAWFQLCADEGPHYAAPEDHRATMERWLAAETTRRCT